MTSVVLTSLNGLVSTSFINVSYAAYSKDEFMISIGTPTSPTFSGLTYPITSTVKTNAPLMGSTFSIVSPFVTFATNSFQVSNPTAPVNVFIEAPCSLGGSVFGYTVSPALPSWITYS